MTALETPDDYVVLENEVSNLLWQWILWKKLFLDEQTVDTLNQCAPSAFATIQESLLDGIFIILFRLIADKNGKSLTIKSLVTQTTEPEVNKQLSESHQRLNTWFWMWLLIDTNELHILTRALHIVTSEKYQRRFCHRSQFAISTSSCRSFNSS